MDLEEAQAGLDKIAQAIYHSRPRKVQWAELGESRCKNDYRKMAMAAVEVLQDSQPAESCARCAFEDAIEQIVYAGDFIESRVPSSSPESLKGPELEILKISRTWLADDTIFRCLNES